ncbi:hypothetical protein [Streptomyces rubiginosohelvolus]|uniref:hypothetical protein n=1 Tax=Streptomyces rubiginosohelvolus TaxID=67362 RepID=UPI0037F2DE53
MPPIPILVITFVLACLPLLYLLSVIGPPLRTFNLPQRLCARPHHTAAALDLPAIGFTLLTDQYLYASLLTFTTVLVLLIGTVAHRARRSAAADDTTAANPHTK